MKKFVVAFLDGVCGGALFSLGFAGGCALMLMGIAKALSKPVHKDTEVKDFKKKEEEE